MKRITLLILASLLITINCLAQPTEQYKITNTEDLKDAAYIQKIDELYNMGTEGRFEGANDISIYYKIFLQEGEEKGAIMLSTGRTEAALKYKEVIYDFYNNGYSVYIHDHRGQGLSDRMTSTHDMGYVDDFQFYIDDMKKFHDEYVLPNAHDKLLLLSHSLGGAVAMSYIEQYPNDFEAASFCSPMLKFSAHICPLATILNSKTPKYAPGQTDYKNDSSKFVGNDVSGCEIRYYRKIAENDANPESVLGGASIQWLHQSCKHMKMISKNYKQIQTPFIIFTAENELVVNPKGSDKIVDKAKKKGKECSIHFINDSMHEILMEKDAQRTEIMSSMFQFFEKY